MHTVSELIMQIAFVATLAAMAAGMLAAARGDSRLVKLAQRGALVVLALLTLAEYRLFSAIADNDFSLEYVASYSSLSLPKIYKVTVLWAGQEGSMLFWAWLLAIAIALCLSYAGKATAARTGELGTMFAILHGVQAWFLGILVFVKPPFALLAPVPVDGHGLNPLLQNPWMAIHPPILFVGFAGLTVPFAMALAAALNQSLDRDCLRRLRHWTLVPWLFLTAGIVIGGLWAYLELGWGGYWAWDPVENASLIPWLTGTALVHAILVQERQGMFKRSTVALAAVTFALVIFGTYLTRSGILNSVHAFAPNQVLGYTFLTMIAVTLLLTAVVLGLRWRSLAAEQPLENFWSREMMALIANLVLVLLAGMVFMGTTWPIWAKMAGSNYVIGQDWFNRSTAPLFMLLLFLMAIAPALRWRQGKPGQLAAMLVPGGAVALAAMLVAVALGLRAWQPVVGYGLVAFLAIVLVQQLVHDTGQYRRAVTVALVPAIGATVWRYRRRYGGRLVHLSVALMYVGVLASSFHKQEATGTLAPGATLAVGHFALRYDKLEHVRRGNLEAMVGHLTVLDNGVIVGTLLPEMRYYDNRDNPMAEVARRTTVGEDLYVVLAGYTANGSVTLQASLNPLVGWVWWSLVPMALGCLMAFIPRRRHEAAEAVAGGWTSESLSESELPSTI